MANLTITKIITQPEETINGFADNLGYREQVENPDYTPSETPDPDNPDKFIANPQSRLEYVSEKADEVLMTFLTQFAERDARAAAEASVKVTVDTTKQALKDALNTVL